MRDCVYIPQVKNTQGMNVESKLFKGLLPYINDRDKLVNLWGWTNKNPEVAKHSMYLPKDENGELTLEGISILIDPAVVIGEEAFIQNLSNQQKILKSNGVGIFVKETDALDKARAFNKTHPFANRYEMKVIKAHTPSGGLSFRNKIIRRPIQRVPGIKQYQIGQKRVEYNENLNNKLRELLNKFGIKIGALNALEERLGVNGVMDTDMAQTATDGLIELIRLAKGIKGEQALPEEFAHFVVEAMFDNPLVQRLYNNIYNQNLTEDILGEEFAKYNELYEGNEVKLVKEAMGKLLAKALLNEQEVSTPGYTSLFNRIIQSVKNFFIQKDQDGLTKELFKAKYQLDKDFSQFAKDLLGGALNDFIDIKNIRPSGIYAQVDKEINRMEALVKKLIDTEVLRSKFYKGGKTKSGKEKPYNLDQIELIGEMEGAMRQEKYSTAVLAMLTRSNKQLFELHKRLEELIQNKDSIDIKYAAKLLKDIRDYTYAYKNVLSNITDDMLQAKREGTYSEEYSEAMINLLQSSNQSIKEIDSSYATVAVPIFIKFLEPLTGHSLEIIGKYKGKNITLKDIVESAEGDIGVFDYFLNSLADTNDILLNLMDQAVRKSKTSARLRSIDWHKKLTSLLLDYESTGDKDTSWIYEKDSNGNLTGKYITEINYLKYKDAVNEFKQSIKGMDSGSATEAYRQWNRENTESVNGQIRPKLAKYGSEQFRNAMLTERNRNFYNAIMEIKEQLDDLLPENKKIPLHQAVQIRKGLMNRIMTAKTPKGGAVAIWDSLKDQFIMREDDYEFGVTNLEGVKVLQLPIYFTQPIADPNDISTDLMGTLTAYATMAVDFSEMNKVLDTIQLGREIIHDRVVPETANGKPLTSKVKQMGRTVVTNITKTPGDSNIIDRLDTYLLMNVYGQVKKREKGGKIVDTLNQVTALQNLGFNWVNSITNVLNSSTMMAVESWSGQFFNKTETMEADIIFGKELMPLMGDVGKRAKTSKMGLFNELFDVMQGGLKDKKSITLDKKLWLSKGFSPNALAFMGNELGEVWAHTRTALALATRKKLVDNQGKESTLWEALAVEPIITNGKETGAKLVLKEEFKNEANGFLDANGEFSSSAWNDYINSFTNLSTAVNQKMFGIYNEQDKNVAQHYAIGRAAFVFRKWIVPNINRRYAKGKYNFNTEVWEEGYYRTAGTFIKSLINDLRGIETEVSLHWNEMEDFQKRNIIRAVSEVAIFAIISSLAAFGDWGDADEDSPWIKKQLELQVKRLRLELGFSIPTATMPENILTIIQSPVVASDYVGRVLRVLDFMDYPKVLESGRYKGHTHAYKYWMELVPGHTQIHKFINPEEPLKFYNR